ncbi:MAG: class I SAM-dependent methyltransferase [Bacteroidaceae bacterium]|nr:class I SAM-dependent methyltransferase [Bacteroidaceae bacterium]
MGMLKSFFTNCACPRGRMGRFMLRFMNLCHAPLTNWGLSLVDFHDGWTMLDIGCGGGATLRRLLRRSANSIVYGLDISEESVAKARQLNSAVLGSRVFVEQGTANELPFDDRKFDLVTAVETIYFWPDIPQCLSEVRRVLKPGGLFVVIVEVADSNSKWTDLVEGMTAYTPQQLKDFLDSAGFLQTEIHLRRPSYATIVGVNP